MKRREREYFKFEKFLKLVKTGKIHFQLPFINHCEECRKECDPHALTKCVNDEDEEYLCPDCLAKSIWYCHCCGQFSAGQSGFDWTHKGYCDNCWDEIESESWDEEEDSGYDPNWDPFYNSDLDL